MAAAIIASVLPLVLVCKACMKDAAEVKRFLKAMSMKLPCLTPRQAHTNFELAAEIAKKG
ncbi:MAG: hypothetical protein U5J78_00740 [Parasphingorhabdus sp.]|nr:hypothetical protein [Parasphingorhabdus sp.]